MRDKPIVSFNEEEIVIEWPNEVIISLGQHGDWSAAIRHDGKGPWRAANFFNIREAAADLLPVRRKHAIK